ncbi:MAG: ABC transporter ATP-binding protein [Thermodesulfobacteriota bacterium]
MKSIVELKNVEKSYDGSVIIKDLSLILEEGEIGCLLGPSGCGKTTILRAIAGFEEISTGTITINGAVVSATDTLTPPDQRQVGVVFQDYALFPHLDVHRNIAFGLHKTKKAEQDAVIQNLLEVVGLTEVSHKYPHELSGGQQQRVALARALAPRPNLLLMDEPFSNLDITLREKLSVEVRDILKEYGISAIMVTHNQNEAFAMGDKTGVIYGGDLLQWDTAYNLYHRPVNQLVADFVGEGVLLPGQVVDDRKVETGLGLLEGDFHYPCKNGCPANVLIRPEDVVHDDNSPVKAEIIKKNFRGPTILYALRLDSGDEVLSLVPSHHNHRIGNKIGIIHEVEDLILFEA